MKIKCTTYCILIYHCTELKHKQMITSIYIEHLNKQHKLVSNWLEYYRECRMKGFKHNKLNAEQLKDDAENGIKHRAKVVNYLLFLERELELSQISKTILKIK